MDLKILKKELQDRLTIFKSEEELKSWFISKKITINKKNKDDKVKEYYDFIELEIKKRLEKIDDILGVYSINYVKNDVVVDNDTENLSLKAATISGIGAAGLLLIIEGMLGPVGWLAAGMTALVGWLYGESKYHNEIVTKLYNNTLEIVAKVKKQIINIIDSLIEQENKILPAITYNKVTLTDEQLEIKHFLEQRKIKYLVHFTNVHNLPSIKRYGLLSVSELNRRNISYENNDAERLDGCLDYISLSVTHINEHLYKRFKSKLSNNEYNILLIDASILYLEINNRRIYCESNAATKNIRKGTKLEDFKAMFADTVDYFTFNNYYSFDRRGKSINETTADQAEILWFKEIPTKYILFK